MGPGWQVPDSSLLLPRQEQSYEQPAGGTFIPASSPTLLINSHARSAPLPQPSEAWRVAQNAMLETDTLA